jgi:predicted metal-dependent HD superfamily phosphohydrolase
VTNLRGRLLALLPRLGARGDAGGLADRLLAAWSDPVRHYHGLQHLEDCLARLDELPETGPDRDRIEAALWFHDAVYDPRAGDNEARSAAWARDGLADLGVDPAVADEVARLVRITAHGQVPTDDAGRLIADIDLSILGRPQPAFDAYEAAIRAEYAWVPEAEYRARRAAVLDRLLQREPLYLTPWFHQRYDTTARENLRRSVTWLTSGGATPA